LEIRDLHRWDVSPREAAAIQIKLQEKFIKSDALPKVRFVAGADASFTKSDKLVHGAVSIFSFPELTLVERKIATLPIAFPYVPGLLTFREGPVLLECFRKLNNVPDLIIFDGQGIAHPRRMGIATHMGILLDTPSIGCAKSHLYGEFSLPPGSKGSYEYISDKEGEIIGACLRTWDNVRPVFVSVGYRIGLKTAIDVILKCVTGYRLPEPLRDAHKSAEDAKEK